MLKVYMACYDHYMEPNQGHCCCQSSKYTCSNSRVMSTCMLIDFISTFIYKYIFQS